jgi:hypothetical protein
LFLENLSCQVVRDDEQIVANVNLTQILRVNITNGGNINFSFNSINDYKNGVGALSSATGAGASSNNSTPFFRTDFSVSSSSNWLLNFGADQATFIGTDNPANLLPLNNVGFTLIENGVYNTGAFSNLISPLTDNFSAAAVSALFAYPQVLINKGTLTNAGDVLDNKFTIFWQCGTAALPNLATNPMNTINIINLPSSPAPDNYIANIIFELEAQ